MELLQLRYFRTVAGLEHMTRAAEELRIAQPALSKTIARLESEVGVPLFDRQNGRIRLNAFGKAFLDRVETALTLLDEGRKEVSEMAGLEHGSIHLATWTLDRLSEPLSDFLALHPEVNFRITQAKADEMERLMEAGEVDICFTTVPIDRPGFKKATVLNEDIYLVVPAGHRFASRKSIRLSEVAEEPFVGYKENYFPQKVHEGFFRKAAIAPHYVCRVDEPAAILSLVRAGLGVALFGCKGEDDEKLVMLPIEHPVCQREYQLIWNEKRYLSLAARKFRDFVVAYFAQRQGADREQGVLM